VKPVPLATYEHVRPLLLAWAESVSDALDECPLPTAESWVYFAVLPGKKIKVGWTRRPDDRPFSCWRDFGGKPMAPALIIANAGRNVERLTKRAAYQFGIKRGDWVWDNREREVFYYDSPVLALVGELRCAATASFHRNPLAPLPRTRRPNAPRRQRNAHWRSSSIPASCVLCRSREHRAANCPDRDDVEAA
jgi:hypothetical protein